MKSLKNHSAKKNAFSLLELLIVISIMVILTGAFLVPKFVGVKNKAKIAAAKANIITIKTALENYYIDCGKYPSDNAGLRSLVEDTDNIGIHWNGPYLSRVPKDPWNKEYVYAADTANASYAIKSFGADGKEGGTTVNQDITE
ncbi:MAG TPA: type II secretion system protein GspG [Spirochaetia bacterium]|nr:type II secretion system protein GspG [Spirochaetia bacterium]